jgi:surfactin synthase thioesterase subunit
MREQFHRKVLSYVPEWYGTSKRPIKAIGHSLGGVMLFDLAVATTSAPLYLSHLVTLGSQSSFFHLQHRRSDTVKEYAGEMVALPPTIQAWTNVLDENDWLSFAVAPIFRLSDGRPPVDQWVDNTDGTYTNLFTLAAHGLYWGNPAVHAIIREAFAH